MIEIQGLTKRFGSNTVLDSIDLRVGTGEVLLLLGANGAGKSTLFRCILGLVTYSGHVRVDGLDPLRDGKEVRRRIGYMAQAVGLYNDLTVDETLDFHTSLRDADPESAERLLTEARLTDARGLRIDEISGGMRQRLAFALAVLSDPAVLLLDEPTSSLDGWSRRYLGDRITELAAAGKTILVSTHAEHTALGRLGRPVTLEDGRLTGGEECAVPDLVATAMNVDAVQATHGGGS